MRRRRVPPVYGCSRGALEDVVAVMKEEVVEEEVPEEDTEEEE